MSVPDHIHEANLAFRKAHSRDYRFPKAPHMRSVNYPRYRELLDEMITQIVEREIAEEERAERLWLDLLEYSVVTLPKHIQKSSVARRARARQ